MAGEFWLSDGAWAVIEPLLPKNQPGARRVDERRPISGMRSRLQPKLLASPKAATRAVAFITPMPGMVASRRAAGFSRAI